MNTKDTNQFVEDFYNALQQKFANSGYCVDLVTLNKNNQEITSLAVRRESEEVAANLYTKPYECRWEKGASLSELLEQFKHDALECLSHTPVALKNHALEAIRTENLRLAIVNYENNKSWLDQIPHMKVLDLAVFAKIRINEEMTIKVTDSLLDRMKLTREEVLDIATRNSEAMAKIENMGSLLLDMARSGLSEMDPALANEYFNLGNEPEIPLYVLRTKDFLDGAALISSQSILKDARKELGSDFFILPSSIHEVLLVPNNAANLDLNEFEGLVRTINHTEVPLEARLSYNVYLFDGKLKMAQKEKFTIDPIEMFKRGRKGM